MPNLADAVLEAGGKVYGRAAATNKFGEALSVDSSGYVVLGSGLNGVKVGADYVAETTTAGAKLAFGVVALDGSNPTPVSTGLTTVTSFTCSLAGTSAPGVGTSVITVGAFTAGSVDIYAWKPTSSANPTLIASTGTENVYWVAVGT